MSQPYNPNQPQQPYQGPPPGYGPPPQAPPPAPKKKRGWLLPLGTGLLGLILGSAVGGSGDATTAAPGAVPGPTVTVTQPGKTVTQAAGKPAPTVTVTEKGAAAPTDEPASAIADGTYLVGDEIATGQWKSSGSDGGLCYADTKNKEGDILEQEVAQEGAVVMRVTKKAYTFTSRDCGTWKKVG